MQSLLVVASLLIGSTLSPPVADDGEAVDRARRHRLRGEDEAALEVARDWAGALEAADPAPRDWERADAARLVETHVAIAALGEEERAELAAADRALSGARGSAKAGLFDEALERSEDVVHTYVALLGPEHEDTLEVELDREEWRLHLGRAPRELAALPERAAARLDRAHPLVARAEISLAIALERGGDAAEAEARFAAAWATFEEIGGPLLWRSRAAGEYGRFLWQELGRFADAEPLVLEGVALAAELAGERSAEHASQLANAGAFYLQRGDLTHAEVLQRRSLAMLRRHLPPGHPHLAHAENNLAVNLRRQGRYADAEPLLRSAVTALRDQLPPGHPRIAQALTSLATLLASAGRAAESEDAAREALTIMEAGGAPDSVLAMGEAAVAYALELAERYEEALPHREAAYDGKLRRFGPDHQETARSQSNLGTLLGKLGRPDEAIPHLRDALRVRRAHADTDGVGLVVTLSNLAHYLALEREFDEARTLLEEAGVVYERERRRVGPGIARATFSDDPYAELAGILLHLGERDEAWRVTERARGRALLDQLRAAELGVLSPRDRERGEALTAAVADRRTDLAVVLREGVGSDRLAVARAALDAAEAELLAHALGAGDDDPLLFADTWTLARIQASLAEDEALIVWSTMGRQTTAIGVTTFCVRREGEVVCVRTLFEDAADHGRPARLRDALAAAATNPYASRPAPSLLADARALYDQRIAPIAEALEGVERLVVVPDNAHAGVPVEALVDGEGHYLIDRFEVVYAPSASVYAWLGERGARDAGSPRRALLVGDPPFRPEHVAEMERDEPVVVASATPRSSPDLSPEALALLDRLTASRKEVEVVAALFDEARVMVGPEASEGELLSLADGDALAAYDVLHVATHTLADDVHPERSAIVLSQVDLPDPLRSVLSNEPVRDGLITAAEIVGRFRLDADLVTLSACESALGRRVSGEGYVGLAHALLRAGARSVCASLWSVRDDAASALMQGFYARLAAGEDRAAALRAARIELRELTDERGRRPFEHPGLWASFVLTGRAD